MIRGLLKTTALAVVAGGLVLAGRGLSQANNAAGTQYFAELVNKIVPPPPPPHTDPNVVDLSDKKGPLIPRIPSACANQNAAQMLAVLPPGPIEPGPCPYPFPYPRPFPCPGPMPHPYPVPTPMPLPQLLSDAGQLSSANGGSVQPTPTPTFPPNPHGTQNV